MDLGIIQITTHPKNEKRYELFKEIAIPACIKASKGKYVLVSPPNNDLQKYVESLGGKFSEYTAWEKDMSRKWRQGLQHRKEEWVGFFADDTFPDENWCTDMETFLKDRPPGQYSCRAENYFDGTRHQFGEDWMQFPNRRLGLAHRPLKYDVKTGYVEDSPTAYFAVCLVHREVLSIVEPFGIFGAAPDVMWSLAIRECGYPIKFNVNARFYFGIGNREDNR
tara:strand:- start:120 stop:785 length:666 start_codon:yes stop_codon:yes gene_type:complete